MGHDFDRHYWDEHWHQPPAGGTAAPDLLAANPYLVRGTSGLQPGSALDAGCGEGAEASWLAARGWQVTAADIAPGVLARAAARAADDRLGGLVRWVEADLSVWEPASRFDLVTTSYAHPAMPQLDFYDRIGGWVAPGGTLLIVGHLHGTDSAAHEDGHKDGHGHHPPAEASVTAAGITARLDGPEWDVVTAEEHSRTRTDAAGRAVTLHDVVVRATRR